MRFHYRCLPFSYMNAGMTQMIYYQVFSWESCAASIVNERVFRYQLHNFLIVFDSPKCIWKEISVGANRDKTDILFILLLWPWKSLNQNNQMNSTVFTSRSICWVFFLSRIESDWSLNFTKPLVGCCILFFSNDNDFV